MPIRLMPLVTNVPVPLAHLNRIETSLHHSLAVRPSVRLPLKLVQWEREREKRTWNTEFIPVHRCVYVQRLILYLCVVFIWVQAVHWLVYFTCMNTNWITCLITLPSNLCDSFTDFSIQNSKPLENLSHLSILSIILMITLFKLLNLYKYLIHFIEVSKCISHTTNISKKYKYL